MNIIFLSIGFVLGLLAFPVLLCMYGDYHEWRASKRALTQR